MATNKYALNVISKLFGSIQPKLVSVGATRASMIRSDGNISEHDPTDADVYATLQAIKKSNRCTISWHPRIEAPKHATLFRDAMKEKEVLYQFILMLSVEGRAEQRAYLKGTVVKSVTVDPRFGDEVVDLVCKTVEIK